MTDNVYNSPKYNLERVMDHIDETRDEINSAMEYLLKSIQYGAMMFDDSANLDCAAHDFSDSMNKMYDAMCSISMVYMKLLEEQNSHEQLTEEEE